MVRSVFLIFWLGLTVWDSASFSQCPQGAIGATGAGCGCLAGCDLTSFGGPNCGGAGVGGNCTTGYVPVSVDILVPDGCTFTVTAVMANRPGCTASGADGSCATCDRLKVDIPGGPKPVQIGGSNASLTDSYTLAGPGTIRVSGGANRADEIISYTTTFSGTFCTACESILPVELTKLSAAQEGNLVAVEWSTASEQNNDYFLLERSVDGSTFEIFARVDGIGSSGFRTDYRFFDSSPPVAKTIYYRLTQVDADGSQSHVRTTSLSMTYTLVTFQAGEIIADLQEMNEKIHVLDLYSADGCKQASFEITNNFLTIPWSKSGLWMVCFPEIAWTQRIVIP